MAKNARKSLDFITSPEDCLYHGENGKTVDIDEYAVGRALISGWLKYSNLTPSRAVGIPTDVVLKDWKDGKFDIDVEVERPSWKSLDRTARLAF